ncbi:alpha-amylase family glycosyl hydrolase [Nonomuraea angiospora]|uniref:alpha-amylase family glycosyl hydrolase n=1 Tax=Nonomuraea angiospora TaxID=46172 RepID=UPI00343E3DEE
MCDLGGLDDLDQSNPTVSQFLIDTYKDWVDVGFDGIRVDAAKHIAKPWLATFEQAMGVPTFGEAFVGDVDFVSDYQNYEWGMLDFPLFFPAREAFAADADMNAIGAIFAQDSKYDNANRLETFLDNHDRARFLARAGDNFQRLRSAMTFLLTARGIPVIYYGTEQADDGNFNPWEDPIANKDNRKDMTSFSETSTIYTHIKRLTTVTVASGGITGKQITVSLGEHEAKVYAPGTPVSTYTPPARTITKIRVHYNTGVDHNIAIRGDSSPFRGDRGRSARNVASDVWEYEFERIPSGQSFQFKPLIDDTYHSTGSNYTGVGGTTIDVYPTFPTLTTIRVHKDVGYGNSLTLRGSVAPLSWTTGQACANKGAALWICTVAGISSGTSVQYKPLINDTTWSQGSNYTTTGGSTVDITPTF